MFSTSKCNLKLGRERKKGKSEESKDMIEAEGRKEGSGKKILNKLCLGESFVLFNHFFRSRFIRSPSQWFFARERRKRRARVRSITLISTKTVLIFERNSEKIIGNYNC